jgi:hypothetical protein
VGVTARLARTPSSPAMKDQRARLAEIDQAMAGTRRHRVGITRLSMTVVSDIVRAAALPPAERAAAIGELLPRIRWFVTEEALPGRSCINALTKAARAVELKLAEGPPAGIPGSRAGGPRTGGLSLPGFVPLCLPSPDGAS